MSFFIATIGELVITCLCVLFIWLRVLIDAVKNREATIAHKQLLLTSIGLVLTSIAIIGLMTFRAIEYWVGNWPYVSGLSAFYVMLACGNIMFIITASLGGSGKSLKWFLSLTAIWTIICIVWKICGFGIGVGVNG